VETVNWYEALAYCNWLSQAEGLAHCFELSECTNAPGAAMECTVARLRQDGGCGAVRVYLS
jgi:hypothetical protein